MAKMTKTKTPIRLLDVGKYGTSDGEVFPSLAKAAAHQSRLDKDGTAPSTGGTTRSPGGTKRPVNDEERRALANMAKGAERAQANLAPTTAEKIAKQQLDQKKRQVDAAALRKLQDQIADQSEEGQMSSSLYGRTTPRHGNPSITSGQVEQALRRSNA